MPLRLALIQMKVSGGCAQENLDRAVANIAEAARHGAQVALLPETMDLGWTDLSSQTLAQPIPIGIPCQTLARAAVAHGLYVCAGLTEADRGRVCNAAVLLGPDGHPHLQGAYGQDAQDILYVDIPVNSPAGAQTPR